MARSHGGSGTAACPVAHGGGALAGGASEASQIELYGYRNFLTTPSDAERHKPLSEELLWRLARSMHQDGSKTLAEGNPDIPSGYTYLLQLVAHDCVHTPTPFWQIAAGKVAARNGRVARLRLDTLYGLGPVGSPLAYAPDDDEDTSRSALRLGPMRWDKKDADPPLRDIARCADPLAAYRTKHKDSQSTDRVKLTDPLIADPRNEDNAILAQMTVLWHMVHNAMLGVLVPPAAAVPDEQARETRFVWARAATTLVYRGILRKDLLHRLLHPSVYKRYDELTDETGLLDRNTAFPRPKVPVPLEFSHGAMRFAHAMIRPSYRITGKDSAAFDVRGALQQTSARKPGEMPLDASWILRWSNFFDGLAGPDAKAVNASLLIRPRYAGELLDRDIFPVRLRTPAGTVFDRPRGLGMQDLLSAAKAPMWSVRALHAKIATAAADKHWARPFDSAVLADEATRGDAIAAWLRERPVQSFDDDDVGLIAADPPLPFYILFEAEHCHGGKRLGPLGSILLAETFFGAFLGDPLPGETPSAVATGLDDPLRQLAAKLDVAIAPDVQLPAAATMADLIVFVASRLGLTHATPDFL
ncbi:peroxidase family protein [Roseomonas sp. AR75]|uniref:peroxidase family protein n=1 Tax=Roseomonas sp. AR75 TaxID=2562311 RepID=UPI0010BFE3A0|nr:peroxidase family protein [Roseomonas sp. AR75]